MQIIWRNSSFRYLWSSQVLTAVGQIALTAVVMMTVYEQTASILGATLVLIANSIASFLGSVLASARIQQFSLVTILTGVNLIRACLIGLLWPVMASANTVGLFIILFLLSFVQSWYAPARIALLADVVDEPQYMRASGSISIVNQLLMAVSWGLSGMMAVYMAPIVALTIMTSCSLLAAFCSSRIRSTHRLVMAPSTKQRVIWATLWRQPVIRSITFMDMAEQVANTIWTSALLLAFTKIVLGRDESFWGWLNASYFIGAIVGGALVLALTNVLQRRLGQMIGLSSLLMAVLTFMFTVTNEPFLSLALCVAMGPIYQVRDLCQEQLLQMTMVAETRAQTLAARDALLSPWVSISFAFIGFLADTIGVGNVYYVAALLYSVSFGLAMSQRTIRTYTVTHAPAKAV